MADSCAGARNIQDELEHLIVTESKEVLKKNSTLMGACQRDTGANRKSSQWIKLEYFEQQNQ